MTIHPTGDAPAASERVVEAVARAMAEADSGPEGSTLFEIHMREFGIGYYDAATVAIEAYQKAMRE